MPQNTLFRAYVDKFRQSFPDTEHRDNDELVFNHAIDSESSLEILHELRHGLVAEETSRMIEFRRKQRKSWFRRFLFASNKRRTFPEGGIYDRAINKIEERIKELELEELEACG
jgi:hypothetical protein